MFPGNQSLRKAIIVLSCAGLASSVVLAWNIVRSLDSQLLLALIDQGNKIYTMRFEGDLSGLMYVGFLPYAASALAGAYAARVGRITFISVLPLLAMTVDGVLSMQRGGILISIVLFVAGAYITPFRTPLHVVRWKMVASLGLLLIGFLFVTMIRGVPAEFEGQGATLNRISDVVPSLPSSHSPRTSITSRGLECLFAASRIGRQLVFGKVHICSGNNHSPLKLGLEHLYFPITLSFIQRQCPSIPALICVRFILILVLLGSLEFRSVSVW